MYQIISQCVHKRKCMLGKLVYWKQLEKKEIFRNILCYKIPLENKFDWYLIPGLMSFNLMPRPFTVVCYVICIPALRSSNPFSTKRISVMTLYSMSVWDTDEEIMFWIELHVPWETALFNNCLLCADQLTGDRTYWDRIIFCKL